MSSQKKKNKKLNETTDGHRLTQIKTFFLYSISVHLCLPVVNFIIYMDKKIYIIGCGPGAKDLITLRGKKVIKEADVIVGSRRLIADFGRKSGVRTLVLENNWFILFLDPGHNLKFIKSQIGSIPKGKYRFYVTSNLSMPTEKMSGISFVDFDNFPEESLSLLIVRREDE